MGGTPEKPLSDIVSTLEGSGVAFGCYFSDTVFVATVWNLGNAV